MQMAIEGSELIEQAIELAQWVRVEVNAIPGLYCFGSDKVGRPGVYSFDTTKVTVTVKGLGMKGADAERILRHEYKVQAELSDMYNVLFLITLGDSKKDAEVLVNALKSMAARYSGKFDFSDLERISQIGYPASPETAISPREAIFGSTSMMPFTQSAGFIAGEIITFYPPGIPVLCPGERITQEIIDYCQTLMAAGLHISGPEDFTLKTIKVMDSR
jgi:lysine decarboxylase